MNFDKYINKLPSALIETRDSTYEYKLARLYAYNFYFGAVESEIDECQEGLLGGRENNYLDGVFLNTTLDEDQIDIFSIYYVPENGNFEIRDCYRIADFLKSYVESYLKQNYSHSKNTIEFLKRRIEEFDVNQYRLKIITNYVPSDAERNDYRRRLDAMHSTDKISIELVYGDDFLQIVEENTAPFDYVLDGNLAIDSKDNVLKYGESSFICNISAKSLKELWKKEGKRGLLAMNLRYYIESKSIDEKIENSIIKQPDNFWYYNNGIIIVCEDFSFSGNSLNLKKFSIVNGGQTTRMIGEVIFDEDFYIVCKVVKNTFNDIVEKNTFVANVAEASNTQKPIKAKDIIANRIEQRTLKTLLNENGVYIEIKRGDKCNTQLYPEVYQRTKNNELAQDLFSFIYLQPGSARNNVTKILQQKDKYDKIFVNHNYTIDFLKDLIWLEKAFIDYSKKIKKNEDINSTKQNLVYNGKFFTLASIGYFLKNIYCFSYYNSCKIYKSHDAFKTIYYNEQCFNHKFIKESNFKEFKQHIFGLFDYIIDNFITPTFIISKDANPSLGQSNFTKTDKYFTNVLSTIEVNTTKNYDNEAFKTVASYFKEIDESQESINEKLYEDNCNKAINDKNKKTFVPENTEENKVLERQLYLFRIEKAKEYNTAESKIFTTKQLEKLVQEKPKNSYEFSKICKTELGKHLVNEILDIIYNFL